MTFLAPIPAIIAAAITVPALVVFYLLKLRRRPVRVSSTLLWQQATRDLQVNVPFRWLRPTWLFFLQFLILALFLLALGRPAINMEGQPPSKVALLIDRSASMSARDADGRPRLEEAKARAIATIDSLARSAPGTAVGIIAFAAEPRLLTGFSTDRAAARSAINAIEPTDQPADMAAALRLASAVLATDATEEGPRQRTKVVLFSDGGSATDEGYTLPGAEFRFERTGPAPAPGHDNVGIVALAARRDWDDPASVRIFARLQNAAATPTATNLSLLFEGRAVETRPLVLPAAAEAPADFPVTFRVETREGGLIELRVERPDLLGSDNAAALALQPATKPRIQVVIPDPPPTPEGGAPTRGPEWLITSIIQEAALPMRIVTASAYERDAASPDADRPDLLIFDRVRPRAVPRVASLSFGAGLPLPGLDAPAEPTAQGSYFLSWQRTHPLLRHVALDTIYVGRPLRLAAPESEAVTELARGAAGPLMLLAEHQGVRHIVVGFSLADSTWPLHVGFTVFLASAIDYLTLRGEESAGRGFTTAQPAQITYAGPRSRITLQGTTTLATDIQGGDTGPRPVTLGLIERAGIYRLAEPGADGAESLVAVNLLDPGESALATRDAIRVGGETVAGKTGAGDGPREIWPWLVLAALVLLSVEWLLNAWLMRA